MYVVETAKMHKSAADVLNSLIYRGINFQEVEAIYFQGKN
jgi:hypothetical protein